MSNFYNLDNIKKELNKQLARGKTLLKAWENVSFPTKKDGTQFVNMSKNISGAKYTCKNYAMQPGENELTVYSNCYECGYISDSIDCYQLVKYLKNDNQISKTQNYMSKQPCLEQVYKYDLDDIKQAVKDRINYLTDRITSLTEQLEIVDTCYNDFKMRYANALEALETNCITAGNSGFSGNRNDIYYMILDTVKEKYPYC